MRGISLGEHTNHLTDTAVFIIAYIPAAGITENADDASRVYSMASAAGNRSSLPRYHYVPRIPRHIDDLLKLEVISGPPDRADDP